MASSKLSPADFDFIRQLIVDRSGIVLDAAKVYLVETRLAPLVRREGLAGINELIRLLRTGARRTLEQEVVEALATNETFFFRDAHVFECLSRQILPELVARRGGQGISDPAPGPWKQPPGNAPEANAAPGSAPGINIWSAACSSGQEPYSVAMVWQDQFALRCRGWDFRLIASDLCLKMLEKARAGCYSALEVGRGLPEEHLRKWFRPAGASFQISDTLREAVQFREINLIGLWPPLPLFDLVLLRNVLIYMNAATRAGIFTRLRSVLRPGAYVLLGTTEPMGDVGDAFERVEFGRVACLRLRESQK